MNKFNLNRFQVWLWGQMLLVILFVNHLLIEREVVEHTTLQIYSAAEFMRLTLLHVCLIVILRVFLSSDTPTRFVILFSRIWCLLWLLSRLVYLLMVDVISLNLLVVMRILTRYAERVSVYMQNHVEEVRKIESWAGKKTKNLLSNGTTCYYLVYLQVPSLVGNLVNNNGS